jgi:hypothetical protein
MSKTEKLKAMVQDLRRIAAHHHMVVDKIQNKQNGETKYFFKLQFEGIETNIEDVFAVVKRDL